MSYEFLYAAKVLGSWVLIIGMLSLSACFLAVYLRDRGGRRPSLSIAVLFLTLCVFRVYWMFEASNGTNHTWWVVGWVWVMAIAASGCVFELTRKHLIPSRP